MHTAIEIVFYILLTASAIMALQMKNLLAAGVVTTIFSFIMALLFAFMGAVDVGFTEAAVGAGVVGVYFVALVYSSTRRTRD